MKTTTSILRDLSAGQSTTDALADRLTQPPKIIHAFCQDLEVDGLIEHYKINDVLTVWLITDLGRNHLQP